MKNYIKKQQAKLKRKRVGNIDVFIKDAPEGIDSLSVIAKAIKKIPTHLVSYIDTIYVGKFDHLLKRDLDASYSSGMMFLILCYFCLFMLFICVVLFFSVFVLNNRRAFARVFYKQLVV